MRITLYRNRPVDWWIAILIEFLQKESCYDEFVTSMMADSRHAETIWDTFRDIVGNRCSTYGPHDGYRMAINCAFPWKDTTSGSDRWEDRAKRWKVHADEAHAEIPSSHTQLIAMSHRFLVENTALREFKRFCKRELITEHIPHLINRQAENQFINYGFTWSSTNSGVDYWNRLNIAWKDLWNREGLHLYSDELKSKQGSGPIDLNCYNQAIIEL